jgi:hypothetical protein
MLKQIVSFVFNGLASAKGEQLFGFVPDSFGSNVGQGSDKGAGEIEIGRTSDKRKGADCSAPIPIPIPIPISRLPTGRISSLPPEASRTLPEPHP